MSYYQHTIAEIAAYFRITPEQMQKDIKTSIEIGKKYDGNLPSIFEEVLKTESLSSVSKLLFIYSLGRTVKSIENNHELELAITEALQKGIELGQQVPEGCQVKLRHTKEGVEIELETPQDKKPEGIAETQKTSEEIMYR